MSGSIGAWLAEYGSYLLIPFISAAAGWGTNWVAIKMLFWPRETRPIFGQGLIPSQRDQLIEKVADEVLDLFSQLHRDRRMTLILVTHSDEVARRAQRRILFKDGRIKEDARVPQRRN